MKFLYEFRTPDNEKHSGSIRAADKEAAYAALKKQGIKPCRFSEAPGFFNKLFGKGKRWLAIVLLSLVAVCSSYFALFGPKARIPKSSPRHQIYGDPAYMNSIRAGGFASVFEDVGERWLARFAIPGENVPYEPLDETLALAIAKSLDHKIEIGRDDPRECIELKQVVNGIKGELREYLTEGTVKEFVTELYNRQVQEQQIIRRVEQELKDCNDSVLWQNRNASLKRLGLKTLPLPESLQK